MVDEVRNRRLRLAGRQMVGDRRGRAEGHPVLLVGRPGRRDRAALHPVLLAGRPVRVVGRPVRVVDRQGRAGGRRGRRIGAGDRRALVGDRRGRVVGHPARAGQAVGWRERVFYPPDAIRGSGLGVVLYRANAR